MRRGSRNSTGTGGDRLRRGPHQGGGFPAGRRRRMFRGGDLRLVVLEIIQQAPVHGYEIIKALEESVGGDYRPSPGTIYPILNQLEDLGYTGVREDAGRKEYSITAEGTDFLHQNQSLLDDIHQRLSAQKQMQKAQSSDEIQRALENVQTAIRLKLIADEVPPEEIRRIADLLDRTALAIERGDAE